MRAGASAGGSRAAEAVGPTGQRGLVRGERCSLICFLAARGESHRGVTTALPRASAGSSQEGRGRCPPTRHPGCCGAHWTTQGLSVCQQSKAHSLLRLVSISPERGPVSR